jgi:DNA-binding transcriptional ArsR family regulator
VDKVFAAIADSTRRQFLDRLLAEQGQTLTELIAGLEMRRQSATRHLQVLEDAGLVVVQWHGRQKRHFLNAEPIADMQSRWFAKFSRKKTASVVKLKFGNKKGKKE